MKTTAIVLIMAIGVALGYLLGTESGREQRDALLEKIGRKGDEVEEAVDAVEAEMAEAAEAVEEAVGG